MMMMSVSGVGAVSRGPLGLLPFKFGKIEEKGTVLIANRNILPGEELFFEFALLSTDGIFETLSLKEKSVVKQIPFGRGFLFVFLQFNRLSAENKNKILQLFGTPKNEFRKDVFTEITDAYSKELGLSKSERDLFERLAHIVTFNGFCGENDNMKIFETISRMSHSCQSNCTKKSVANLGVIRSIRPIAEGEELIDFIV